MSANFESLQAEYDNAQDTIEALKKQVADVNRDFKNNLEQSNEIKVKLAEAEHQLKDLKQKHLQLEADFNEANDGKASITAKLSENVSWIIARRSPAHFYI